MTKGCFEPSSVAFAFLRTALLARYRIESLLKDQYGVFPWSENWSLAHTICVESVDIAIGQSRCSQVGDV